MKRPRIANKGFIIGLGVGALILAAILLSGIEWPPNFIYPAIMFGGAYPLVFLVNAILMGIAMGTYTDIAAKLTLSIYTILVPAVFGGIIYKYKDKWSKALTITVVAFIIFTLAAFYLGMLFGLVMSYGAYDGELDSAIAKDDPEACNTVSSQIHDDCVDRYAKLLDDPQICIKMRIEDSVYNCVVDLGKRAKDISYCDALENSQYSHKPAKPQCQQRVAFNAHYYGYTGNPENCFELETRQDDCIRGYINDDATEYFFEDINVCDRGMNQSVRDFCRHHVAIVHNNTAECPEYTREECVNYLARIRHDPETCKNLIYYEDCVADVNRFLNERGFVAVNTN